MSGGAQTAQDVGGNAKKPTSLLPAIPIQSPMTEIMPDHGEFSSSVFISGEVLPFRSPTWAFSASPR
jgi:hypothetical protein